MSSSSSTACPSVASIESKCDDSNISIKSLLEEKVIIPFVSTLREFQESFQYNFPHEERIHATVLSKYFVFDKTYMREQFDVIDEGIQAQILFCKPKGSKEEEPSMAIKYYKDNTDKYVKKLFWEAVIWWTVSYQFRVEGVLLFICLVYDEEKKRIGIATPSMHKNAQVLGRYMMDSPNTSTENKLGLLKSIAAYARILNAFGIYHGDLHQGNILVNQSGKISILDFDQAESEEKKTDIVHFFDIMKEEFKWVKDDTQNPDEVNLLFQLEPIDEENCSLDFGKICEILKCDPIFGTFTMNITGIDKEEEIRVVLRNHAMFFGYDFSTGRVIMPPPLPNNAFI